MKSGPCVAMTAASVVRLRWQFACCAKLQQVTEIVTPVCDAFQQRQKVCISQSDAQLQSLLRLLTGLSSSLCRIATTNTAESAALARSTSQQHHNTGKF